MTRIRWGGSLLEEARLHGAVEARCTVQPHAVAAETAGSGDAAVERFTPSLSDADLAVRVTEHVAAPAGGVSLAEAKVVVSGGRGVGSAEGFAIVEELAGAARRRGRLLPCRDERRAGGRIPTRSARPGTKISPDLYVPCGISGATQHIAGCRGAKRILAINADPEAPIFASADYAVIGDLHEILPAISAEIRKVEGRDSGPRRRARPGGAPRRRPARSSRGARGCSGGSSASASRSSASTTCRGACAREAEIVLGQRKLFQRLVPGAVHAVIFWGFLVLFPTIVIAMIGAVDRHSTFPWLGRQGWFAFMVDLFAVLVLVGVLGAS